VFLGWGDGPSRVPPLSSVILPKLDGDNDLRVPFFDYSHVFGQHRDELLASFLRIAESGAFILQEDATLFEQELAQFCGVAHAVGVGNATDGLELIFRALGIGLGDEVVLPSHTFVASAAALVHAGATPVFAEVGSDHLLDPEAIAGVLTDRTRAIMPTQLNGRTANMDAIEEIARTHGLLVLEDSAQGLGSTFRGRMAGTFAPAGVYSFYPAKTLGALGDAGAVVTDDPELDASLRRWRDHGRDGHGGGVNQWGRNSRLDNLQAAFLRVKLSHLGLDIDRRREIGHRYIDGLEGLGGIVLPPRGDDGVHFDVFQNFELESDDRDGLREHLHRAGIGTILQWGGSAVHEFSGLGDFPLLPRTEATLRRSLLLPLNTSLTDDQVDYVTEAVREFADGPNQR
jgi:dTDP-4-amino-4,6-dideoxygalactose transaminase